MEVRRIQPLVFLIPFCLTFASCDNDEIKPGLRAKIDYNTLTADTPYSDAFVDDEGVATVDLAEGNTRLKMFQALNSYMSTSISANEPIEAARLQNMFDNSGNPFTDIESLSISGDELNNSGLALRNVVGSSRPAAEQEAIRQRLEEYFDKIEEISHASSETASQGVPGKLGSRLVDEDGIELNQIIQKSLIGALELDYIGNVLLDEGLSANNQVLVSGKNYTELEHNWDIAYGLLTLNPVYLAGATDLERVSSEFGAGSYIWEYNRENYDEIHPAFLRGRAAVVNNDVAEIEKQALFIRTEFEKALANAALGYLGKWKNGATDADRAHAISEGLGFIYSLRFAKVHGGDDAFSDDLLEALIGSENGYWDLTAEKINAAAEAIQLKFNL